MFNCNKMKTRKIIVNHDNSFNFEIRADYDCDTSNAVYVFECEICHKQYVGETKNEFRFRFNNHKSRFHLDITKSDASNNFISPLAIHYKETGHHFNSYTAYIAKAGFSDHIARKCFQSLLIDKLNTFHRGLNQNTEVIKEWD